MIQLNRSRTASSARFNPIDMRSSQSHAQGACACDCPGGDGRGARARAGAYFPTKRECARPRGLENSSRRTPYIPYSIQTQTVVLVYCVSAEPSWGNIEVDPTEWENARARGTARAASRALPVRFFQRHSTLFTRMVEYVGRVEN